ncbi:MAG: mechanosensitive ion channel domain-containing protein [Legionellales bacterium]
MESFLESIPYSTTGLKITALVVLGVLLKLSLKTLRIILPHIVKTNRTRYHIQDLSALVCGLALFVITIIFFAVQIKEFAIPFSVIGAGVAFALQEVIASVAGRIVIVMTGLYQIGDRIQIGDRQGDVIHVSFMRTSLMEIGNWVKADQYSGRIVHVTNAMVLKENVINYSGSFPFVWDEIVVPIRYGNDQHMARRILLDVTKAVVHQYEAAAAEKWMDVKTRYMIDTPDFTPAVTLIANDNWMEFTVRYLVPHKNRRTVKDKLFTSIVEAFEKTKGKVEFASMTVEITGFPKLDVNAVEVKPE